MLLTVVSLPIFTSCLCLLFGRFFGSKGVSLLLIYTLSLSTCFTLSHFFWYSTQTIYIKLYNWCSIGSFIVNIEFLFDNLTIMMLIVILIISLIVHIYSTQYLKSDAHLTRFMIYLSIFTFFMLVLVSTENLLQLFFGWEGVGICSYLLINFWYTRIQANKAALKAIFVNKIGDIFILFALALCYYLFGSLQFSIIFSLIPYLDTFQLILPFTTFNFLNLIGFCFLLGAIGKSAQIGLHVWLPDAMEGPTPVSALLHAATMVTAGVFLLIRMSFLFEHLPLLLNILLFIGGLTAFFAATVGLLQYDLKRIIAFSTCSQLGYMFVACGMSEYTLSLFHLFNHAFFKALLFLAAGNVIHALNDEQDIRKMGGLASFLPLTFTFFVIASLSLMGIPFLSGFYSKDLIIEYCWLILKSNHIMGSILILGAAFCTAAYSFRLLFYVFLTRPNFYKHNLFQINEPNSLVQIPLILLTINSIIIGYLFSDLFVGFGSDFFNQSIFKLPSNIIGIEIEYLNLYQKQLPLIGSLLGCFLMYFIIKDLSFFFRFCFTKIGSCLLTFLNQKWFFDKIYNSIILCFVNTIFFTFYKQLDKGSLEFFGSVSLFKKVQQITLFIRRFQNGYINYYIFLSFCGLVLYFFLGLLN